MLLFFYQNPTRRQRIVIRLSIDSMAAAVSCAIQALSQLLNDMIVCKIK